MSSHPANRLIHETSPYLLQHAHNPVDWYPWGTEAFEKAKREDKPLLISIGYSTCHWCHVMERECFEDVAIATLMNTQVVAIKVDREERPDIDKIYMTAVSAMTGQGGWPLNVFVTPELKPIYGGTYFPPLSKWGQPAWPDVVRHIGEGWKRPEERAKMLEAASHMTETLQRYVDIALASTPLSPEWSHSGLSSLESLYDVSRGGFGSAPKFPMPVYHHFLLRYAAVHHHEGARTMSLSTLRAMALGGLYDQLGGGFARYSTDPYWHVPHFEKMLYDNAQLAVCYLDAFQMSQDPFFSRIARETLDYIRQQLTSSAGGYYSAEDADSLATHESPQKTEGAFYVWQKDDIDRLLGQADAEIFCLHYGVREAGNARTDPHGEFVRQNILYVAHPIPEVARQFNRPESEIQEVLRRSRQKLFEARSHRPRPHRDDKQITAWNALTISAMAKGSVVLSCDDYLVSAQKAARVILDSLYDAHGRILYRTLREGKRRAHGIADDYAFLVQALLDLYETDFNPDWLSEAQCLHQIFQERFYSAERKRYFMTARDQDEHLLLRMSEDQDHVEPAASSIAVLNLLRLSSLTGEATLTQIARDILEQLGETLRDSPRALPVMLSALDSLLRPPQELILVGERSSPEMQLLLMSARRMFLPSLRIFVISDVTRRHPLLHRFKDYVAVQGKPTAYLCEDHSCRAPTTSAQELTAQLEVMAAK